ncbi:YHS domain-containing (seleno)protein [Shimia ponticola]|uniref:YHS domain-containing (seleno)protein n=1 Tax=Shimia ponticola TaxID=2582893 RepID=UPI0011BD5B23|nr:YHS domain-containing (seleno)protein [Shimia ponticola]
MLTRRAFLAASAAAPVALTALPAHAAEPPVYSEDGVAINGYDPVAYFTEGKPVEGSGDFTAVHDGATFRFASAENRDLFAADPVAYAPQYGGYCAYAVSRGYTATTSPNAWTVHDGKLYLNFNRTVRALWSRDIPGNIEKGDANWPEVLSA